MAFAESSRVAAGFAQVLRCSTVDRVLYWRCMPGRALQHFCDIHDVSQNHPIQLTRSRARRTATEIWTP